jgi:hypothetical protein
MVRVRAVRPLSFLALLACGTPSKDPPIAPSGPTDAAASALSAPAASAVPSTSAKSEGTPPPVDAFAKLEPDFTRCYEDGKKAVPTMTSGKITFHASIDASGKTMCAVPSDDTGLTQDVENCMRLRLDKEVFPKRDAPWSLALPIVVKDSKLVRGEMRDAPGAIETIESQGLTEDVYDVVEGLLPDLYGCMSAIPKSGELRVVYVGARVGSAGQVECALASGPASIPAETRACTAKVFSKAKFRAPKKGYGLLSVPLNVSRK